MQVQAPSEPAGSGLCGSGSKQGVHGLQWACVRAPVLSWLRGTLSRANAAALYRNTSVKELKSAVSEVRRCYIQSDPSLCGTLRLVVGRPGSPCLFRAVFESASLPCMHRRTQRIGMRSCFSRVATSPPGRARLAACARPTAPSASQGPGLFAQHLPPHSAADAPRRRGQGA